ncbi:hypothetical protein [Leptolyngbya phage Lbo-JY46]
MQNEFSSQIVSLSQEQLDSFFSDTPEGTPSANDLNAGKKEEISKENPKKEVVEKPQPKEIEKINPEDIPDFEEEEEEQEDTEEEIEVKKEEPKKKKEAKNKEPEEVIKEEDTPEVKEILKSTVDFLIKSGQWLDFDGREDLEIDNETFGKLAAEQDQFRVQNLFSELVDSTGDYGKAIIAHIKNGGNPEDIIDIFKEQKQIESIDVSTIEGKIETIETYYRDVLGWKPDKVKKHLERISRDGEEELILEYEDVSEKFDEYYQQRLAEIEEQNEIQKRQAIEKQEKFVNNIKSVLASRPDLTVRDQKLVENAVLKFKNKLPNGQVVNDFFVEFAKIQNDPEEYVNLVLYVMDRKNQEKKKDLLLEKKKSADTFKFIKGNSAVKKNTSSITREVDETKINKTDFSSLFK